MFIFSKEVNTVLYYMFKIKFIGIEELFFQLKNANLSLKETHSYKFYYFNIDKNKINPLSKKNFGDGNGCCIELVSQTSSKNCVEYNLLLKNGYVHMLEFCNLNFEDNFENDDCNNIIYFCNNLSRQYFNENKEPYNDYQFINIKEYL